jgi:guanylate kinase
MASLIVISGPSGVGKTTLSKSLLNLSNGKLTRSVSHTTRSPRPGEIDGQDYYFVSLEEFNLMLNKAKLIEHTKYLGNLYGTSQDVLQVLMDQDLDVVLNLDYEGARRLKELHPSNARLIFCAPPSMQELEARLRKRNSSTESNLQKRLHIAEQSLATQAYYDFVVINDDFQVALKSLCLLINKVSNHNIFAT